MPDIGLLELIFIGMIAFLVLGPERLPDFFAQMSRLVRQGKAWVSDVKRQFDAEKQQLMQPIESAKQDLKVSVDDIKADLPKPPEHP